MSQSSTSGARHKVKSLEGFLLSREFIGRDFFADNRDRPQGVEQKILSHNEIKFLPYSSLEVSLDSHLVSILSRCWGEYIRTFGPPEGADQR